MDRLEAMQAFVAAVDEGSLSKAARRLNRSPAALTRAVAWLERELGVTLLHRTTRTLQLSEAGEIYASACRRILADVEEAGFAAAGAQTAPRGLMTITAPVLFGTRILGAVLNDFLTVHPMVRARYLLLDRQVSLVEDGVDIALRIAHLPDSNLIARKVGEVRRVVVASPLYLAGRPPISTPSDLIEHDCITHDEFGFGSDWVFPAREESGRQRQVHLKPRLSVNSIEAAIRSAVDGHGIVRVLSYQIEDEVRSGRLVPLLEDAEPEPLPVHLVVPEGRVRLPKVRAFLDFAAIRLRARLDDQPLPMPQSIDENWYQSDV